jgi:hypothetical protein
MAIFGQVEVNGQGALNAQHAFREVSKGMSVTEREASRNGCMARASASIPAIVTATRSLSSVTDRKKTSGSQTCWIKATSAAFAFGGFT